MVVLSLNLLYVEDRATSIEKITRLCREPELKKISRRTLHNYFLKCKLRRTFIFVNIMFSLRSIGLHLNRSITSAVVAEGSSVFTINRGLATGSNVNVRSKRKDRANAKAFEKANPHIFSTRFVSKKKDEKKGNINLYAI